MYACVFSRQLARVWGVGLGEGVLLSFLYESWDETQDGLVATASAC